MASPRYCCKTNSLSRKFDRKGRSVRCAHKQQGLQCYVGAAFFCRDCVLAVLAAAASAAFAAAAPAAIAVAVFFFFFAAAAAAAVGYLNSRRFCRPPIDRHHTAVLPSFSSCVCFFLTLVRCSILATRRRRDRVHGSQPPIDVPQAVLREKRRWLVTAVARELEPAFRAHARHLR